MITKKESRLQMLLIRYKREILQAIGHEEKRKFLIMRTVGNFLVLFALYGVIATFAPITIAQIGYYYRSYTGVEYRVEGDLIVRSYEESPSNPIAKLLSEAQPSEQRVNPASTDFGIVIPKIGANSNVVANVDAGDEKAYQDALQIGVAHAAGTAFPGAKEGNRKTYLFAHSTDNWWNINHYNAVFFLLKELNPGDEIVLFYNGRRYIYETVETKVVEADEVAYLVEPSDEEVLVLQTCWPPGTTLKRLLVIAKPAANLPQN